jgi:hypothetical protein
MKTNDKTIAQNSCFICGQRGVKHNFKVKDNRQQFICNECYPIASRTFNKKNNRKVPSRSTWLNLLQKSYDKKCNKFRCMISRMKLNSKIGDSLYLTLDHTTPRKANFAIVASVINDMKNDHTTNEFIRNIEILSKMTKQKNYKYSDKMMFRFEKTKKGIKNWKRQTA